MNFHQRAKYGAGDLDNDPDAIPEPVIAGDPDAKKKKQKRKKKPWTLPHWCLYIAYVRKYVAIVTHWHIRQLF